MTSPTNGFSTLIGTSVNIAATATDLTSNGAQGVVTKVDFYNGSTLIGSDTAAPYTVSWTPSQAGSYTLSAVATDSQGASSKSSGISVVVVSSQQTPSITYFFPSSGTPGAEIYIVGTNLSAVNGVNFNKVAASTFSVDSSTLVIARVPGSATTGPVSVFGGGSNAQSSEKFIILPTKNTVVISQIYADGGRNWADYTHDFVELYNPGTVPLSLTGWSLQIAMQGTSAWCVIPLTGTIPSRGYYLVGLSGKNSYSNLPQTDANGDFDLGGRQGKVALMKSITPIKGQSPVGISTLLDFVGYGQANAYEGSYAAPAPDRYYSILRERNTDTNTNGWDFILDYANPRNTATPVISTELRR